jgi:5-hydroxyisourate hydrolase
VLDIYSGAPAEGMQIDLLIAEGDVYKLNKTVAANAQGRTDHPMMPEISEPGRFRLVFHVSDYFKKIGVELPDPPFLDRVSLDFAIANPKEHYHVPLVCSPWSYVTYRGS